MNNTFRLIPIFIFLFVSCSIHGSFKGLYSYYNQTKDKNPKLLVEPDSTISICDLKEAKEPKIYVINGIELKKCISRQNDVVVYIWKPICTGKLCYSLNAVQEQCTIKNKELFIIADYYDYDAMSVSYHITRPVFGIDTKYYKTDKTQSYLSRFLYDLTSKKNLTGSFICFKNGIFFKSCNYIDSL